MLKESTTERPSYGLRENIEEVKKEVTLQQYLHDQGVEVRHNRARCPVHGGDNPQSFSIVPETQRWHCFGCGKHGDLIDLCQAVEGGENWEAMIALAERFGVELSQRSPKWLEWESEKTRRLNGLRDVLAESYRRRYFRAYFSGYIQSIDPALREAEARQAWEDLWPMALLCAEQRLSA